MKIRTDFVTNSSSSSYVTYNLEDSEFCRYLYAEIEEMKEKCPERLEGYLDDYNPFDLASGDSWHFDENCLSFTIHYDGLNADTYLPEGDSPEFKGFYSSLSRIADFLKNKDAKTELRKILMEELSIKNEDDLDYDELMIEKFNYLLRSSDKGDDIFCYNYDYEEDYEALVKNIPDKLRKKDEYWEICREFSDEKDIHLCEKLYNLLKNAECDEHIIKEEEKIGIIFNTANPLESDCLVIDKYRMFMIIYWCYNDRERKEDIAKMTHEFMYMISDFLPVHEIDSKKCQRLFDKDRKNGKYSCEISWGQTD